MARLPDASSLGERPIPVLPRRTPMLATYTPSSGFEEAGAEQARTSAAEMEQASQAALLAKESTDNIRVEDAATQLRQKQIDMTYGKNGFANLKGGDAVNEPILKTYGGQFDQAAADLSGTLANPNQQQIFQRRAQAAGLQLREDITRHIAQQTDVYAQTVYGATLDTNAKLAGARWNTPDAAAVPLLNMENAINLEARRRGLTGPDAQVWAQDQQQKARSGVYANMVKNALVSDPVQGPVAADALLKAHGDQIDPGMAVALTHEIKLALEPIQVASVAEKAMTNVLGKLGEALAVPTDQEAVSTDKAIADEGGARVPTDYSFMARGLMVRGTAPTLAEAIKRVQLGTHMKDAATGQTTKADVQGLLGDAIVEGERLAQTERPGDAQYVDRVVQSIKSHFGTIIAAHEGQQKQYAETLVSALTPATGVGPTTMEQVLGNPALAAAYNALDPSRQRGVQSMAHENLMRAQGLAQKEDYNVVSDLANRIFLDSSDPNKVRSIQQLLPYLAPGQGLNQSAFAFLSGIIDKSQSVDGVRFETAANRAAQSAKSILTHSTIGSVDPDRAGNAANQYYIDLRNKIDEYRANGKDPATLLRHGTPDSMVENKVVMGYLGTAGGALAAAAGKPVTAPTPAAPVRGRGTATPSPVGTIENPVKVANDEEFNQIARGTYYRDPKGQLRQKP